MSHAGEDDVGLLGPDEPDELKPGVPHTLAMETVDLNPPRDRPCSGAVGGDQAEVYLKELGVEVAC
jgi:hypothetical protein